MNGQSLLGGTAKTWRKEMNEKKKRLAEFDINPVFLERWSPRSFTGESIDEANLFRLFEAARWAPSANNAQPWRFIYALNNSEAWSTFFSLLNEGNQKWASKSSALIILLSKKTHIRKGNSEPTPLRSHSLDAGAAWAHLALQAQLQGLSTHAIGGFDRERAQQLLNVPSEYQVEIMIAVGRRGEKSELPLELQEREIPSARKSVQSFVAHGKFSFEA
jgi:nitroreductase